MEVAMHSANTAFPRARLADDVLCEIYYILADEDPSRGPKQKHYDEAGSLGWIRLTHVCRQWRRVGIDLAVLWARITCIFPPDIRTVIERTKNLPLVVDMTWNNTSSSLWSPATLLALPITRFRVYTDDPFMGSDGGRDWDGIFAGRTYPRLEKLSLLPRFDSGYNFKRARKALDAPALTELNINTPRPIIAPSLRTLHCDYGSFWHWSLLLNFIRSFPLLEKLSVTWVDEDADLFEDEESWQESQRSERTVAALLKRTPEPSLAQLSHLQSLTINHFGPNACKLLEHLDLPACTQCKLDTEEHDKIWPQILSRPEIISPPRTALSILLNFNRDKESYVWRLSFTEKRVSLPPSNISDICGSVTMSHRTDRLPDFLDAIPTEVANGIQEITFGHDLSFIADEPFESTDPARWAPSFNRFYSVTVLHIYCYLHAISFSPDFVSMFPDLHTVVLIFNGPFGLTMDASWDRLHEVLAARKAAGRPLARLIFRGNALCHRVCPDNNYAYYDVSLGESDSGSDEEETNFQGEDKDAFDKAVACLQRRQITFEAEAQLVDEVVDERCVRKCSCVRECPDYPH